MKMSKELEAYREELTDLVEKHFPKGECKERGQAMVLIAEALLAAEKCFSIPPSKKGKCKGLHCRCMNLNNQCPNFHYGDHECPYANGEQR